ncbi:MAG TPA: calcium-binding protein [Solirubrobacterales bacterium]|nr:calcium-binding protein [Solirubrobacterales bacterium]
MGRGRGKMKAALLLLAALLAVGAAQALAAGGGEEVIHRCHGRQATIVGTAGDDVLHGTPGRDVIWGGPGDDTIYGSLGNDLICGGAGDDVIHGGRGNDEIYGGRGADRVFGDLGDDKVTGGAGDYDDVAGGLGIDTVSGGPGDYDLVHGDYGYDRMSGGPGKHDIASFATAVAGGKGTGIWASLRAHVARGDGHDKLYEFEDLEGSAFRDTLIGDGGPNEIKGGPGNDTLVGGGGHDTLDGGQGTDGCRGAPERTISCGPEAPPEGSAYVQVDEAPNGGGGVQIVGGAGRDDIAVSFDQTTETLSVVAAARLAAGPGCLHPLREPKRVLCPLDGPARWLMADLGPGNDRFRVEGSLVAVGSVRVNGGEGDDVIRGGPEDDLFEAGPGADRLYGGAGADGLVGGLPGPTFLYGGPAGDLLAAGGGCAGGALVGGGGRDDASFAEIGGHPGVLIVSFPKHSAWVNTIPGCHHVHLSPTDEDMEGSFGPDILIGNHRANAMLGQPGKDIFIGNGGDDVIDARDGQKDDSIQCGRGRPRVPAVPATKHHKRIPAKPATGRPEGRALIDSIDPAPFNCATVVHGHPVPGLNG